MEINIKPIEVWPEFGNSLWITSVSQSEDGQSTNVDWRLLNNAEERKVLCAGCLNFKNDLYKLGMHHSLIAEAVLQELSFERA